MRERPTCIMSRLQSFGITPARAGKTPPHKCDGYQLWDHPRSCGKDAAETCKQTSLWGSPPLVRERRMQGIQVKGGLGITPARAGKTFSVLPQEPYLRDHPRSCGKDRPSKRRWPRLLGSPPLVRERRSPRLNTVQYPRITPARAGKTLSRNRRGRFA